MILLALAPLKSTKMRHISPLLNCSYYDIIIWWTVIPKMREGSEGEERGSSREGSGPWSGRRHRLYATVRRIPKNIIVQIS